MRSHLAVLVTLAISTAALDANAAPATWAGAPLKSKGWTVLSMTDDGSMAAAYLQPVIRQKDMPAQIWLRIENANNQTPMGTGAYSFKIKEEIDCVGSRARRLEVSAYSENNLSGHSIPYPLSPAEADWYPIGAGTLDEAAKAIACT